MQTIRVETPSAKYDVVAGSGLVETLAPRIERVAGRLPRRVFVVTSAEIWALWGNLPAAVLCRGADCTVFGARRKAQDAGQRDQAGAPDGAGGRGSRIAADRFWRRDCGRRGGLFGLDVHARDRLCAGADDAAGTSGFECGRQDGRKPAGGQEPGGELPPPAGGVCRYWGAGYAAGEGIARRADGEREGGNHSRPVRWCGSWKRM